MPYALLHCSSPAPGLLISAVLVFVYCFCQPILVRNIGTGMIGVGPGRLKPRHFTIIILAELVVIEFLVDKTGVRTACTYRSAYVIVL
jgi:hypothetical protein